MEKEYYPGWELQPLFDLMSEEHGLTLLESEMFEIINCVKNLKLSDERKDNGTP